MKVHLDTDLGSDSDDLCALVMLLGWPEVELVGITTSDDPGGRRAGCVRHVLEMARRRDVPVAAGAETSITTRRTTGSFPDDARRWPEPIVPEPSPPGAALDLLHASIEAGATLVAIGPWTNLALLEVARSGSLARNPVVVMGGWAGPPGDGLPQWGPQMDYNVQSDTLAAQVVSHTAALTVVPLPTTLLVHLRAAHLPRLRASGRLGELLAFQAERHGADFHFTALGRAHAALPDDLLNFQYDPLACAVAVGWEGARVEGKRLSAVVEEGVLRFEEDVAGRPVRLVTDVDGEAFNEAWLAAVEAADTRARPR